MAKRQLKLYAKPQAGNTTTTTINNVNQQADATTMTAFTKKLNAFTNNTYEKTDLIETTNVDTETIKLPGKLAFNSLTGRVEGQNVVLDVTHSSGITFGYGMIQISGTWQQYIVQYSPSTGVILKGATSPGVYEVYIGGTETSTNYSNAMSGQVTVTAS